MAPGTSSAAPSTGKDRRNDLDTLHGLSRRYLRSGCHCRIHELMKFFRNLLYFVVGFLLSASAVLAHAETMPKPADQPGWWSPSFGGAGYVAKLFPSICAAVQYSAGFAGIAGHVCTAGYAVGSGSGVNNYTLSDTDWPTWGTIYKSGSLAVGTIPGTCDTSKGWVDSGGTCTRAECVPPQVRNSSTGLCESPCATKKDQYSSGYVKVVVNSPPPTGLACLDGCQVNRVLSVMDEVLLSKGYDWFPIGQTYTGESCSASNPVANPTESVAPSKPAKTPPCASGEGVMTSSSGSVKCVPEGIPDAPKPVVKKEKKVETYPDGTTKGTETTTTTDPNTGATHTSTSSTASGKTDGTAGQAGPVGTTTTTGGTSTGTGGRGSGGSGSGDGGGECDPTLQMCGTPSTDELYEKKDKTISSVLSKFSTDMKATPIGKAVEDSLNIEVPSSGACPDLSANIPYLNTTIDLAPYICSPTAIEYLQVMGTVLKIMVGYIALTWVFL